MANPVVRYNPPQRQFQWTTNAALQLIRERRAFHGQFQVSRNHDDLWRIIANNVFAATGLLVSQHQCRTKWNALKRGYENLIRVITDNPQNHPVTSPTDFDLDCFNEMSDRFWMQISNYLF